MNKLLLILFFLTGTILISCKKNNDSDPGNNTALLTSRAWVIQKNEVQQQAGGPWIDFWSSEPDCERDNKWIFKEDLSLELNESLLSCSGNQANDVLDVLRWAFLNNEKDIEIDNVVFKIELLNVNSLIISRSESILGIVSSLKITYGH